MPDVLSQMISQWSSNYLCIYIHTHIHKDSRNETEGAENIIFKVVRVQIADLLLPREENYDFSSYEYWLADLYRSVQVRVITNDTRVIEDRANVYDIDKL